MKVNSIQNTNTNKINFKNLDENLYLKKTTEVKDITDQYIQKDNLRTPGQILFSIGLIGLNTFIAGVAIATVVASIFKSSPAKAQKTLKNVSNNLVDFSKKVVDNPTTKIQKATNFIKKSAGKANEIGKDFYKKVICKGFDAIPENATKEVIESITDANNLKAFQRLGGFGAVASLTPAFLSKDTNDDGVRDVLQNVKNRSEKIDQNFSQYSGNLLAATQLSKMI